MSPEIQEPLPGNTIDPKANAVDDLFDFSPDDLPPKPFSIETLAKPMPEARAAAQASAPKPGQPAAPSAPIQQNAPTAASASVVSPNITSLLGRPWILWGVCFLVFIQFVLLGFVLWRMENGGSKSNSTGDPRVIEPVHPNVTRSLTNAGSGTDAPHVADADTHPLIEAPVANAAFVAADALFSRGLYSDARKRYFETLLTPSASEEGRDLTRIARLRIAQCLARELASPTSPIMLRFASPLALSDNAPVEGAHGENSPANADASAHTTAPKGGGH